VDAHTRENAYIEGYLSLTLYVIEQVVYYGKKNHILVTVSVLLGYPLRDKKAARTFSELIAHQAGMTINILYIIRDLDIPLAVQLHQ
jgi:hypothetical protein